MREVIESEDRQALVHYRLSRAFETIEEAKYNARGGYYNTAVNRLYYSAYYAVTALLLSYNHNASTHAGVKTLFSLHFIKTGKFDVEYGKTFMMLFENRQSGDYEDFVYCDLNLFNQLLPRTESLLRCISDHINGWN